MRLNPSNWRSDKLTGTRNFGLYAFSTICRPKNEMSNEHGVNDRRRANHQKGSNVLGLLYGSNDKAVK